MDKETAQELVYVGLLCGMVLSTIYRPKAMAELSTFKFEKIKISTIANVHGRLSVTVQDLDGNTLTVVDSQVQETFK